jgi:protein-tyrosine-phosphatase
MNEIGVDLSRQVSRRAEELTNDEFDYVISLGDSPSCHHLMFQGAETIHWRVDDLVHRSNDPEKQLRAFRTVRDQIAQRLRLFVIVHVRSQALSQSVALSVAAASR